MRSPYNTPANCARSVIFMAGHYCDLLAKGGSGFGQLDGVLELLDFADNYVLCDRTAIGGAINHLGDDITRILRNEAKTSDALEIIGDGPKYSWDLTEFWKIVRIPEIKARADALWQAKEHSEKYYQLFDEANVRAAHSYIMLSDAIGADYVPDRLYGVRALQSYVETPKLSRRLVHDQFRRKLLERMSEVHTGDPSIIVRTPSFLLEALHSARNVNGLFASLCDIRNSKSARHYRELVHAIHDEGRSRDQRLNAAKALKAEADAAFTGDRLPARVPRWLTPTVGLSAAALVVLFPQVAPVVGVVAAIPPVVNAIDRYVRDRHNIFQFYNDALGNDLFSELKRIFPSIKFRRENLCHFLLKKDFGWSEDLNFWRKRREDKQRSEESAE